MQAESSLAPALFPGIQGEPMSRIIPALETKLLRLPAVIRRTGLSRSSLYRRVSAGTFPAPVKIGERSCAWASHEVDAWIAATIAKRDGGGRVAR